MAGSADLLLLDRYRLGDRIGRGGMGIVWRGHDEYLRRPIAIKEIHLPDELDQADRAERCRRVVREARAAARLHHPGVVNVHDVVEQDGRPWIIMELIESRSLDEIIKRDGPMSPREAAQIGLRLLEALRAAHRAGVIHRDVKPANVLIGERGRVVLSDFGIATYDGASTLTQSGALLGTPAYMAPELARGERATPASDLWSLGATLYAAVEGRAPYHRDTAVATLGALLTQDPDPPSHAGTLRPVIEGLLRKQPAQRLPVRRTRALLTRTLDESDWPLSRWADWRPVDILALAVFFAVTAIVIGLGFAIFNADENPREPAGKANSSPSTPRVTRSFQTTRSGDALVVRCRAKRCGVFISVSPDNEVLFNGVLGQGEVRQFDDPRMTLVVEDVSTVDVYINGKLQSKGPPGRKIYTIIA